MRTLIVDDEFLALNLLENFIENIPDLQLVGRMKSPMEALSILEQGTVDLLFLDIQMPTLSGNNLLKTLRQPPLTIFTTAYSDYAIEAFELNVVDYLLKPFSFERFVQAVNKAREQFRMRQAPAGISTSTEKPEFLSIKVDGKIQKIFLENIYFIEGLKEYIRFHCTNGRYVTLESLKNMEEQLPPEQFLRVHKSFIVARQKVEALNGNMLEIGTHKIPISRSRREAVIKAIF
jgi:DNA-binding LytR/AlgR family response regulator